MLKKCFIFYNFVSLVLAYLSHHCKCYSHFSHSFMKTPLVSSSLSNCVPINYYQHNSFSAKKKKIPSIVNSVLFYFLNPLQDICKQ